MPTLASQLEHYVLMPMRLVGFVYNGRRDQEHAFGPIPHMAGYIEALPDGAENTLSVEIGGRNYDYEVGEHSYQQQRSARPTAARWLTGTHGGMGFEVGERYPVSHVVYKWLAQDLKRIGLVGGFAWSRQESAVVPFDMSALAHR